jgi:hypothetical protein
LWHSEWMGGGWEDRGSPTWLVNDDEFRRKRNDCGTSRHGASSSEVRRWRTDGPQGGPQKQIHGWRGWRVAIYGEPFMDKEAVDDELAPRSLANDLSSVRVLHAEDVEGVLLPSIDGDERAGWWPAMVVLLERQRVK